VNRFFISLSFCWADSTSFWRSFRGAGQWDSQGACLFSKRLEHGRFVWPAAKDGKISLTSAQLAMLLEGIDWRIPKRTWRPLQAG